MENRIMSILSQVAGATSGIWSNVGTAVGASLATLLATFGASKMRKKPKLDLIGTYGEGCQATSHTLKLLADSITRLHDSIKEGNELIGQLVKADEVLVTNVLDLVTEIRKERIERSAVEKDHARQREEDLAENIAALILKQKGNAL